MRAGIFGCASLQRISENLGEIFSEKIEYLDSLRKNTQIKKNNRLNRSLDEEDIDILKSTLYSKNFMMARKLHHA